jgi:CO/xanthine dehydrogenase FAD-binding subunit
MDLHTVTALVDARTEPVWQDGDAWLAGGTYLFSEPQPHLRRLLDLSRMPWPAITEHPDGRLELAATCTVAELSRQPAELIGQCCRAFLASFKVWNLATVGGNLCNALPAGPMISLTAALHGDCLLLAPDGSARTLPVTDFVTGPGRTALRPGELLRSISLPATALARRTAFRQASLSALGRSAVLVIGTAGPDGVEVTVTASTARPVRFTPGPVPDHELARDLDAAVGDGWFADVHGDPEWRRHLTHRFAGEVVRELAT